MTLFIIIIISLYVILLLIAKILLYIIQKKHFNLSYLYHRYKESG